MRNFGLIGAAGYIAPRHMNAIQETGNELVAALDPNDSVGVLDSYFPEAHFFTEFERFDRHLEKLKRKGTEIDYISIASPNYLHDAHIRFALRLGADAICEKPLVVNPWNIDSLRIAEEETGRRVNAILQLRLHPDIIALRTRVRDQLALEPASVFDVDLSYLTSRGHWYLASWKGEEKKSGGLVANIGIHFFDMLIWVFGGVRGCHVSVLDDAVASGYLELEHARVRWFLSVDQRYIPEIVREAGMRTYRSITVDGDEVEFSGGFTDLHTTSYREALAGRGFTLDDALTSIELVHSIRGAQVQGPCSDAHPLATKFLSGLGAA